LRHARLCAGLATGDTTDAQLKRRKSGTSAPGSQGLASGREEEEGTLSMWVFLSARLRTWLLLAIALPLARLLVHGVAIAAERHDPSARTAKLLHRADAALTAVSGRASRGARR
jgi:hypothetical protein